MAPPQHGKSVAASVCFPAWWIGKRPDDAIILTSYAAGLAHSKSRQARNLVETDAFAELFGAQSVVDDPVETDDASRAMNAWSIANHKGGMLAAGVGGGITGHGAELGIIDDPVENDKQVQSKAYRDMEWDWYQTTFRTRIHEGGAIVLITTRWHEDDLAGRLIKAMGEGGEQWVVVRYPAIAETQAERDESNRRLGIPAGMDDPLLRKAGEPLAPKRYSHSALLAIKGAVGGRAWTALYGGSPRPLEGRILDSSKLVRIDASKVPPLVKVVRRWDLAFSEKAGADFVAGGKVGADADGRKYILHMKRIHGRWVESKSQIVQTALDDGVDVICAIEANGTQLGYYQDIQADPKMGSRVVIPDKPDGSKEMRASVWGSRLEDKIIFVVPGEWNEAFYDEMDAFPNGENDDQVDAVSGAINLLTTMVLSGKLFY